QDLLEVWQEVFATQCTSQISHSPIKKAREKIKHIFSRPDSLISVILSADLQQLYISPDTLLLFHVPLQPQRQVLYPQTLYLKVFSVIVLLLSSTFLILSLIGQILFQNQLALLKAKILLHL